MHSVRSPKSYPKSLQIPADPCKSLHKKATVSKTPAAGIAGIAGTEALGRRRGKIVAMGCTYRAQEAEKQLQGPHLGEQRSPKTTVNSRDLGANSEPGAATAQSRQMHQDAHSDAGVFACNAVFRRSAHLASAGSQDRRSR